MAIDGVSIARTFICSEHATIGVSSKKLELSLQKKETSVTFWAEQKKFYHAYDTSMMLIVTKPGIIIDVVGSYFYDKKS